MTRIQEDNLNVGEYELGESGNFVLFFALFSAHKIESGIKALNDYLING